MRFAAYCFLLSLWMVCTGCSDKLSSNDIASAQNSLDQAKELVAAGDFKAALPAADTAAQDPALDVDQYVEAVLLRARCRAETGDVAGAEADLTEAEQGAPDAALLHFTRGVILHKQGQDKAAKKEFSIARRMNPALVYP